MVSTIKTLSTEVVHLITAGEVIDSLASVVRELVENSLDAGATRIVISVWPEEWRVRVVDNGCGMSLDDLQRAATAHSTSKIRSCADLWKITSLGFRGEALHSLTNLAEVEILSRPSTGEIGWQIIYGSGGEPVQVKAAAIAPGTVVTVANLFGNCKARRRGLPKLPQQMKSVQATIQQIALCHPHVTWQVSQDDRPWFSISPVTTLKQLLPQFIQQVEPSDLREFQVEIPQNKEALISLVLGLPDRCHRHRPDWVRVAVNGRMVKCPELEQTILSAFHKTLPRDRYPVCFLHMFIPPDQINWNRHPAKAEIYLNEISYWQEHIAIAIDKALRHSSETLKENVHTTRVSKLLKAAEEKGSYNLNRSINTEENQTPVETNPTSLQLRAVGQVNKTYIIAEYPGGMWLIEQHIAHERVLYEQLSDNWQIVPKEPPVILYQLSPAQVSQLQRLGLDIEPFGEQLWAIRSVPAILLSRDDCADAILELSLGGDLQAAQVAVACRSAIRNGTTLSLQEMQALLDQWKITRNPRTCPHGRPIYLSLEEPALARFFRRNWVVGKSHGI
ncbi:DNA mismatch repair endonuclease MutL [Aetokthonos hydrillicola Thurmond2011]|jgi:DNA mismatch repair protein MutL|uniref:DNA mismatch repair protein MutL n=1 Tax=Aetokthonos hydrillicola Thurmond2011 TaxID=2712845 RepID=A0AAP5MCR3_9CYAN|nr:DNA mismatch repair endonuclease MutL [Aetokthonos hydrillicola]MBO3461685.1 DNA mismatch repair endonuclease MutL [Aetokthonos hydrillicola CCALA 1050]MBW4590009.1 DNA mismatch repair endonuclease MutL [Aetokthonos hydrillicola CCALA 1050]MDR9900590.1 DNA mismatch repair endonuclease MutL [Aetokthonos hydrillicola Thurmond2011]